MFNDSIALAVIAAARKNNIDPAAMLAIVEVETGGKTFEHDGRTPQFLYERHVAWREAKKVSDSLLAKFRRAALAIPKWNKAVQYKDERTSAQRLQLIRTARAIDKEVANRSASWGLGQTMGFLAEDLGFSNACTMVDSMVGSIDGQIECMVRELKHSKLIKSLNAHDWTRVARIYNGAGYAANQYDTKLRDAYARWSRKLPQLGTVETPRPTPPEQQLEPDEIRAIQKRLRDLGYHEVGRVDGHWGTKTTAAISAFQAHEGLTVTGQYDDATKAALDGAELPRPQDDERTTATVNDLRKDGSDTIKHADGVSLLGKLKAWIGGIFLAGGAADAGGALGKAQDTLDKVDQAKTIWGRVSELLHPIFSNPTLIVAGVALLAFGIAAIVLAERIKQNRLKDHQTGEHAGPTPLGDGEQP